MISSLKTVVKTGLLCQLKRDLCSFQSLVLQIFEISCRVPSAFYFICHATGKDVKMESAGFQHKSANEFSQKESHSMKLKSIF